MEKKEKRRKENIEKMKDITLKTKELTDQIALLSSL